MSTNMRHVVKPRYFLPTKLNDFTINQENIVTHCHSWTCTSYILYEYGHEDKLKVLNLLRLTIQYFLCLFLQNLFIIIAKWSTSEISFRSNLNNKSTWINLVYVLELCPYDIITLSSAVNWYLKKRKQVYRFTYIVWK